MKRAEATRNCGAPRWYARVWMLALFMAPPMVAAAQVDTVAIYSAAMGKAAQAVVVLPERYLTSTERFPVVYLLNGWSGSYRDWPTKTDLKPLADRYEFIIVCPDGGYASWHLDSLLRKDSQCSTRPISQERCPIISTRTTGRLTAPLGGFSAASAWAAMRPLPCWQNTPTALREPGACMSGAMTLPADARRAGLADVLGEYENDPRLWEENSALLPPVKWVGRRPSFWTVGWTTFYWRQINNYTAGCLSSKSRMGTSNAQVATPRPPGPTPLSTASSSSANTCGEERRPAAAGRAWGNARIPKQGRWWS